jgi:hypothetical protein
MNKRTDNAFAAILVVLSVVCVKVAFIHNAVFLTLLVVTIPAIVSIMINQNIDDGIKK